jgi:hypothetical protein
VGYLDTDNPGLGSPPVPTAVAQLAGGQWGVVGREQLLALGVSRGALEHWLAVGRLHRMYRCVYAVGHARVAREGRWLAAVLACGDGAVISHRSAAAHWGLLATSAAAVDVTARRGRRGTAGSVRWSV